jgi:5-methylcytosine-specific restriction enzyme B
MARLVGHDITPVLNVVVTWRDRCLLDQGSLFSDTMLWTQPHVAELVKYYVGNIIEGGDATFLEKLRRQLTPASPGAKQLAAEMYWVMLLFVSKFSAIKKRKDIVEIAIASRGRSS